MNSRYFVTYRDIKFQQPDPIKVSFGRFCDQEEAIRCAKLAYDIDGYGELLSVRPETTIEAWMYRVYRFFIRTVRIAIASALGLFAFSWLSGNSGGIGDIPFSSLTLNIVLTGIFKVAIGIGTVCLCWFIAFGNGPDH